MYVDGSGSLWSLQSHNLFIRRDASEKNGFIGQITSYHPNMIERFAGQHIDFTSPGPMTAMMKNWARTLSWDYKGAMCALPWVFAHSLGWSPGEITLPDGITGCAYHLNWVCFALAKHEVLFLTPSSAHHFFMAYCTHQLKMGNFSLDTRSRHY